EEGESGEGRVVGDPAVPHQLLELRPGEPPVPHVLLLGLPVRFPRRQVGRDEDVEALPARPVRAVQVAEVLQRPGAQAGLLGELDARQLLRLGLPPPGEGALREAPRALPDRVPVLLDEVEPVPLDGDDQHEVRFVHDPVDAARAVPPLDRVLPDDHPGVLVDDACGDAADRGLLLWLFALVHALAPDPWRRTTFVGTPCPRHTVPTPRRRAARDRARAGRGQLRRKVTTSPESPTASRAGWIMRSPALSASSARARSTISRSKRRSGSRSWSPNSSSSCRSR